MWSPQQPQQWPALLQQSGAAPINLPSGSTAPLLSGNTGNRVPFPMSSQQLASVSSYPSFVATPHSGSSSTHPTFSSTSIYASQKPTGAIDPSTLAGSVAATATGVASMITPSQPYQVKQGIFSIPQSPQPQLSSACGGFRSGMNLSPSGHGNPMNVPSFLNSQMASTTGYLPNPSLGSVSSYPRLIPSFNPSASAALNPVFYSQALIKPPQTPGNRPSFPNTYMNAGGTQSSEGMNIVTQAGTMEMRPVSAPQDEELVNIIHRVAEYCATNAEMEEYVRQNNGHEHKFRFLVGGEGSDYFRWVLYCYNMGIDPTKKEPSNEETSNAAPAAASTASESPSSNLVSLLMRYQEPTKVIPPLSEELEKELDDVLSSLEHQATADGIRTARHWVEVNCNVMETAKQVAFAMLKKMETVDNFTQRLHLLYVIHDVLQNEALNKEAETHYLEVFKPYLVWLLRPAYQLAIQLQDSSEEKVTRILKLWLDRNIITETEQREMTTLMEVTTLPSGQTDATKSSTKRRSRFDQGPGGIVTKAAPPVMEKLPLLPSPIPLSPAMTAVAYGNLSGYPLPLQVPQGAPLQTSQFCSLLGGPPHSLHSGILPIASQFPVQSPHQSILPSPFHSHSSPEMLNTVPLPPHGMPLTPSSGFDKLPETLSLTPEKIPVGLMSTMLKMLSKRGKNMQTAFVPYKPLDGLSTPQTLPPVEPPSENLLERLDIFYDELQDEEDRLEREEKRNKASSRSTRSSHRHFSRSREASPSRRSSLSPSHHPLPKSSSPSPHPQETSPRSPTPRHHHSRSNSPSNADDISSSRRSHSRGRTSWRLRHTRSSRVNGGGRSLSSSSSRSRSKSPSYERYRRRERASRKTDWDRPSQWAQAEMGVGDDGSVMGGSALKGERLGLGAHSVERKSESDAFEQFRKHRASKYHEHIAHKHKREEDVKNLCFSQASRREPGGLKKIADSEKLCYICQKPGHIARDCKFGLS
ncbi:zinc knuckle domain-containing protein [Cardiosporidium cionae]|uniref:Zinc knuckle domain-containing protein n=1 Tax=Cardiosporidium cionae TaxID=476202 RepID=A0ABQ7JGE6_9APIC|nr:zinc knuckle domain-containing protein [Cardiosporidium cionae]|eukprot:KAF8823103.1 zinc knuckle domain-containing protein [Cardiosporidium cionae]